MELVGNRAECMIDFQNVTKRYGRVSAVDQVSFQVLRGEICGFLGPNGAGKTTSLRMLLGLVRPSGGHIQIQGVDVHQNTPGALDGVGAIIEESHFYPYLTGEQNLRQVLRLRGLGVSTAALRDRLTEVGLREAANRRVKGYSLGMRQRLALALAKLQDPAILILDEPMNGLDPAAMREFRMHLMQWAESGVTILLSSHILSEVEQLATRLVFINQGRIVGVEDRRGEQSHRATFRSPDPSALRAWFEARGIKTQSGEGDALIVPIERPEAIAALIRPIIESGLDIWEARLYTDNLEQQYLARMGVSEEVREHAGV